MVPTQATLNLRGIGMLLRIVAVVFSSVATILSTFLPLLFHYTLSSFAIIGVLCTLLLGAILIHGILTHTFNDLTDYQSGTDEHSPALLYFILVGILLSWMAITRPLGGLGAGMILLYGIYLVLKMDIEDVEEVTKVEKFLLLSAFVTAIWLGIFV